MQENSIFTPYLTDPRHDFDDEEIKYVCASSIQSMALSKDGHAITWGCGSDSWLSNPEAKCHRYFFQSDVPRLIELLNKRKGKCSY